MQSIEKLKKERLSLLVSRYIQGLSSFIPVILDVMYLSTISPEGIGGIGVLSPLIWLATNLARCLSRGAELAGVRENRDSKSISTHLKNIVCSNFIFISLLSIVLHLLIFPISISLNYWVWHLESKTYAIMIHYLWWLLPKLLINGIITSAISFFNINFKFSYVTRVIVISTITNSLLNTIFMLTLIKDEISASRYLALATSISALLSVIMLLFYIRKFYPHYFVNINLKLNDLLANVKQQISFGTPFAIEIISVMLAANILVGAISQYGSAAIAGYTFAQSLTSLVTFWGGASAHWAQLFMSLAIDKNSLAILKHDRIAFYRHLKKSILFAISLSIALVLIYFFILSNFLNHSTDMFQIVMILLLFDALLQIGRLLNLSIIPALILMKEQKYVVYTSMVINYLYYIPLLILLPLYFKSYGIWLIVLLMLSDEVLRAAANSLRVKQKLLGF